MDAILERIEKRLAAIETRLLHIEEKFIQIKKKIYLETKRPPPLMDPNMILMA